MRSNTSQLLHAAVLWLYFLLPSLLCDNLHCYYSPILEKEKTFKLIVTRCPPNELCFKALARYGNHSGLSARGCMAEKDCSQLNKLHLKGTLYTMSYTCCDRPYCNSGLVIAAQPPYITVTLVALAVTAGSL